MRLFVLSLLALSAHGHSIAYRTNILGYQPTTTAGLVQGYVRYLDANGAERLIPYDYPEPNPNGLQRLSLANVGNAGTLVRADVNNNDAAPDQTALFRAWCEQRYNALKTEIDKLRAEGQRPSANMLAQFRPLEQIVKSSAFEPITGLTPEVQRARAEHLRLWNEARLQVVRAQEQQKTLANKSGQIQPQKELQQSQQNSFLQQNAQANAAEATKLFGVRAGFTDSEVQRAPEQVQYTAEVLRAREEHLKLLAGAQQQQSQQQPAAATLDASKLKSSNNNDEDTYQPLNLPKPVEDTEEVKRVREEHIRLIELAKLKAQGEDNNIDNNNEQQQSKRVPGLPQAQTIIDISAQQSQPAQQSQSSEPQLIQPTAIKSYIQSSTTQQVIKYTPEVQHAIEEHMRLVNEAKRKLQDRAQDDSDNAKLLENQREDQRARENELRLKEEQLLERERLLEIQRQKEEERMLEAERIALQQEEQQRIEKERYEEAQRLKNEEALRLKEEAEALRLKNAEVLGVKDEATLSLKDEQVPRQKDMEAQRLKDKELNAAEVADSQRAQNEAQLLKSNVAESQTQQSQTQQSQSPLGKRADFNDAQQQAIQPQQFIIEKDKQQPLSQSQSQSQSQLLKQGKQTGYYWRIPAQYPSGSAYIIGSESQPQYFIPATPDNPFLLRTAAASGGAYRPLAQSLIVEKRIDEQPVALQLLAAQQPQILQKQILRTEPAAAGNAKPIDSHSGAITTPLMKVDYGSNSNGALSELEKATREHFRAHEIALEQLRLANVKSPWKPAECNQA